jgi:hypothetical protein
MKLKLGIKESFTNTNLAVGMLTSTLSRMNTVLITVINNI